MSQVPKGWRIVRLEDVCEVNPRYPGPDNPAMEVSFVPMPAVSDGEGMILPHESRRFSKVAKGYTRFRDGDVIFAKITPCMENGKVALASGLKNGIASGSTEFHVLHANSALLPAYLWRFLRQESYRGEARRQMTGAVGQQRVPAQFLKQTTIPLPPLAEQRRIVAKLDNVFARSKKAREELSRIPRLTERYKQAILAAAFRGELTSEWRSNNPDLSVRPEITRIENERKDLILGSDGDADSYRPPEQSPSADPFKVPDTWLWLRAEAVCDFITKGTTPTAAAMTSGSGDVPYIKVYNLTFDASLNFQIDPTFISNDIHNNQLQRSKVYPGDVLINIVGPPLGKVSLVPDSWPEWNINQAIAVFRPVPSLNRRFLAFLFLSEQVLNWAISRSKATAGQRNLTLQICRDIPIPVCSPDEQDQIVQRIDRAFIAIDRAAAEASRATDLIDRLDEAALAKAFRGDLIPPG